MATLHSSVSKHYTNQPDNRLALMKNQNSSAGNGGATEKGRKTEKIVRFARDTKSLYEEQSTAESVEFSTESGDIISWIPSEHLYSDDTFLSSSHTGYITGSEGKSLQTDPIYGTSSFIDLDSEDETKTLSEYSYTDSFASSAVFSSRSQSDTTSREWGEQAEIVKDIEELEESEFVKRDNSLPMTDEQEEDLPDEENFDRSQQNFILHTISRLKMQTQLRTANKEEATCDTEKLSKFLDDSHEDKLKFYHQLMESCQKVKGSSVRTTLPQQDQAAENNVLEHYGLSSMLVDQLRMENLQYWQKKKLADLEADCVKSAAYLEANQNVEASCQQQKFIDHMMALVHKENMEDCIMAHFIKMHPVKWISDFIRELPRFDEEPREVLLPI